MLMAFIVIISMVGCANTSRVSNYKSKLKVNKQVIVPNDTKLVVYLADSSKKEEAWANGKLNKLGKAISDASEITLNKYFTNVSWFDKDSDATAGLFIKLVRKWQRVGHKIELTLEYDVFNAASEKVYSSSVKEDTAFNVNIDAVFFNLTMKAMDRLSVKLLNNTVPSAAKYPDTLAMNDFDLQLLINQKKPLNTGTGFYVNASGDVVTAQHVVKSCLITKVNQGDIVVDAKVVKDSKLLDVALLKTNQETKDYLKFRKENSLELGEKITTVSYPLNGVLASSPNMTFGNITSKKALSNSKGLFQFSAPIQPGSSGGAIVSGDSEVLGLVTSTLKIKDLVEKGIIPQNVNFALDAKYLKKFLAKNNVAYQYHDEKPKVSANEYALQTSLQVACYQ